MTHMKRYHKRMLESRAFGLGYKGRVCLDH